MKKLINFLEAENRHSRYLAFFRLFICFHLLKDLFFTWPFLDLLYSNNTFVQQAPTFVTELLNINTSTIRDHYQVFIGVYVLVIMLFFFGVGRNFTALALFLIYDIFQRLNHLVLNGGDNLLRFVMLYMVFADSFKYFSVHAQKASETLIQRPFRNFMSNLAVFAICFHLCMAYFWSAVHKIHADVWFNGVATYYTFQLERFSGTPLNSWLAKNGIFVTLSTYFTLLFEMFFPVLVWVKRTRMLVIISGIALHLGIYVFMMIYDFEILFLSLYGFFFTDKEWRWFLTEKLGKLRTLFQPRRQVLATK